MVNFFVEVIAEPMGVGVLGLLDSLGPALLMKNCWVTLRGGLPFIFPDVALLLCPMDTASRGQP